MADFPNDHMLYFLSNLLVPSTMPFSLAFESKLTLTFLLAFLFCTLILAYYACIYIYMCWSNSRLFYLLPLLRSGLLCFVMSARLHLSLLCYHCLVYSELRTIQALEISILLLLLLSVLFSFFFFCRTKIVCGCVPFYTLCLYYFLSPSAHKQKTLYFGYGECMQQ